MPTAAVTSTIKREVAKTQTAIEELRTLAESMSIDMDVKSLSSINDALAQIDFARRAARATRGMFRKYPLGRQLIDKPRTRISSSGQVDRPDIIKLIKEAAGNKALNDWRHISKKTTSMSGSITPGVRMPNTGDQGTVTKGLDGGPDISSASPTSTPSAPSASTPTAPPVASVPTTEPAPTTDSIPTPAPVAPVVAPVMATPQPVPPPTVEPIPAVEYSRTTHPKLTLDEFNNGRTRTGAKINYDTLDPVQRARAVAEGKAKRDATDDLQDWASKMNQAQQGGSFQKDMDPELTNVAAGWIDPSKRTVLGKDIKKEVFDGMMTPLLKKFAPNDPIMQEKLKRHALNWDPETLKYLTNLASPAFYAKGDNRPDVLPKAEWLDPYNFHMGRKMSADAREKEWHNQMDKAAGYWNSKGTPLPPEALAGKWSDSEYDSWANAHVGKRSFEEVVDQWRGYNAPASVTDRFKPDMTVEAFRNIRNQFHNPATGGTSLPASATDGYVTIGDQQIAMTRVPSNGAEFVSLFRGSGVTLVGEYNNLRDPATSARFRTELEVRYGLRPPEMATDGTKPWDIKQWRHWIEGINGKNLKAVSAKRSKPAFGLDGRAADKVINNLLNYDINLKKYGEEHNAARLDDINKARAEGGKAPMSAATYNEKYGYPTNVRDWTKGHVQDAIYDMNYNQSADGQPMQQGVKSKYAKAREIMNAAELEMAQKTEGFSQFDGDADFSNLGSQQADSKEEYYLNGRLVPDKKLHMGELKRLQGRIGKKAYNALQRMAGNPKARLRAREIARALGEGRREDALQLLGELSGETTRPAEGTVTDMTSSKTFGGWGMYQLGGVTTQTTKKVAKEDIKSNSNLAKEVLAGILQNDGAPMLKRAGDVLAIGQLDLENPEHLTVMREAMTNTQLKPVINKILKNIQGAYDKGTKQYNEIEKLIGGKKAEVEEIVHKNQDGGSSGVPDNPDNVLQQVFKGFTKMLSVDGLKDLWGRATGGDISAWLPLLLGGGALFFIAKGLMGGGMGSLLGGALALGAGAWLAGGGFDTIKGMLGFGGGKEQSKGTEEEARKAKEEEARRDAEELAKLSKDAVLFDPAKHQPDLAQGLDAFGIITNGPGTYNPRKMMEDFLMQLAKGEKATALDTVWIPLLGGGKSGLYKEYENGKFQNCITSQGAKIMLGKLRDAKIAADSANLDRGQWREKVYSLVRETFTHDPAKGEKVITGLREYAS